MNAPTDFQPKLIYLARRHPALSRTQFVERWRRHGALGMAQPRWRNIARYIHCDVLHPYSARTKLLSDDYDGVGFVWHRSQEARLAHVADTTSRTTMERDELETFAEPVVNFCTVTRETLLLKPDGARPTLSKLIRFLKTRERTQAAELAAFLMLKSATVHEQLQTVGAPVLGHAINEPLTPDGNRRWGLDVDCIEELWFEDAEMAVRAAEVLGSSTASNKLPGHVPFESITVITNEVQLYQL